MITAAFAFVLLAAGAGAATLPEPPDRPRPALREKGGPKVRVTGDRIRLGDLAPAVPRTLFDLDVAPAPPPGRTMVVSRAAMQDALRRVGADPSLVAGLPAYRTVERAGMTVTARELEARVRAAVLEALPLGVGIEAVTGLSDLVLPQGTLDVTVRLGALRRTTRIHVTVKAGGRPIKTFGAAVHLSGTPKTPQPVRPLARGRVVQPGDIRLAPTPFEHLGPHASLRPKDVVGKRLATRAEPGRPIARTALSIPPDVERGAQLELVAQAAGLRISRRVVALEPGRVGRPIRVRALDDRTPIQAVLVSSHTARIELGGGR